MKLMLSKHFSLDEFICRKDGKPCPYCGGSIIPGADLERLAVGLEAVRLNLSDFFNADVNIFVLSGHRCFERNKEVSTCIPHFFSMHTKVAADIKAKVKGNSEFIASSTLYPYVDTEFPLGGVGLYSGHVHVDVRGYKARWG